MVKWGVFSILILFASSAYSSSSAVCRSIFDDGYKVQTYVREYNPQARKTIVLLHGLTESSKTMEALAKLLSRRYNVLSFDMYGHGRYFDETPEDIGIIDYKSNVENIRSYLEGRGIKNPIIIGHSYGGAIAFELAQKLASKPSRVILLTPYVQRLDKLFVTMVRSSMPWLPSAFGDAISEPYINEFITQRYKEKFLRQMGKRYSDLTNQEKAYLNKKIKLTIATIRGIREFDLLKLNEPIPWDDQIPLTVVGAENDDLVPARQLEHLVQRLQDKQATIQFEPGLDHNFPLNSPERTLEILEKILGVFH